MIEFSISRKGPHRSANTQYRTATVTGPPR